MAAPVPEIMDIDALFVKHRDNFALSSPIIIKDVK
jgi:hypothetical protein